MSGRGMTGEAPIRPRFVEGQFQGFNDLTTEQGYRDSLRHLHNIGAHVPGVVDGLELATGPGFMTVSPGMAVDAAGRTLIIKNRLEVSLSGLGQTGVLEVWLTVTEAVEAASPADGSVSQGVAGVYLVEPDRRVDHEPSQQIRATEILGWARSSTQGGGPPVLLGQVSWTGDDVTVSEERRPWAGLVGEAVAAPSERGVMNVGSTPDDTRRFTIATQVIEESNESEDGDNEATGASDGAKEVEARRQLSISSTGDVEMPAGGVLAGDLVVIPTGELSRDDHTGLALRAIAPPKEARPWAIYRTKVERDGRQVQQLRFEIQHPGDDVDPSRCRAVVGVVSGGEFTPCLSVDANCLVRVHRDLVVEGLLAEGPIGPDPTDPLFAARVIDSFIHGISGAAGQAEAFFAARLVGSIDSDTAPVAGSNFDYRLTVRNVGSAVVTHGQAHVVIGVDDEVLATSQELDDVTFSVGDWDELDLSVPIPGNSAGKTLTISVLVVGIGSAGHVVSDSDVWEDVVQPVIL